MTDQITTVAEVIEMLRTEPTVEDLMRAQNVLLSQPGYLRFPLLVALLEALLFERSVKQREGLKRGAVRLDERTAEQWPALAGRLSAELALVQTWAAKVELRPEDRNTLERILRGDPP
jgi:hypothetical protein